MKSNRATWCAVLSCACLQLLLLSAAAPVQGAPRVVRLIVAEASDDRGKPKPIAARTRKLLDYLEHDLAIRFDIRKYPWIRAELNASAGEGLIFGLAKTPERLATFRFSDMALGNDLWLVTRSDRRFTFNSIEDLRGKTVGAVRGYSYGEQFERASKTLFRIGEGDISSREARLLRLWLRRVDVLLLYAPSGTAAADVERQINTLMATRLKELGSDIGFSVLPKPLQTDVFQYFAVARQLDDGLIDRINEAMARGRRAGLLEGPLPGK